MSRYCTCLWDHHWKNCVSNYAKKSTASFNNFKVAVKFVTEYTKSRWEKSKIVCENVSKSDHIKPHFSHFCLNFIFCGKLSGEMMKSNENIHLKIIALSQHRPSWFLKVYSRRDVTVTFSHMTKMKCLKCP